jgi:ribosomal-protein-alanine N-acetyltransferase
MSAALRPQANIRAMTPADLSGVGAVEQATYQFPWSAGIFRDCLLAGYPSLVMVSGEMVIGYGIMSVAAGEAHILNICLHTQYHRRGLGRRMLRALLRQATASEVDRVYLEVRPSNVGGIALYASEGFEEIGIRPRYYQAEQGREDAVILALTLPASAQ